MKLLVLIIFFQCSLSGISYSQNKKDLIGTWYGKHLGYKFRQDGTAQCYSKTKVPESDQKLTIDKNLNYRYIEITKFDTMQSSGHILLKPDTITFVRTQTNDYRNADKSSFTFFLFHLDNTQLIYSVTEPVENKKDDNTMFTPVETSAEYSLGKYQFLKTLYAALTTAKVQNNNVAFLHGFTIIIDKRGNADLNSLKSVYGADKYFDAIKSGIMHLRSNFIPVKQNGKFVTGKFVFYITY